MVGCFLDDKIPFCELFVIPYVIWYLYLAVVHIYTLLADISAFKKLMWFLIITFGITTVIYILFPNMQMLRPSEFERENALTRLVYLLYAVDTNTNVCPSLHVIGSFAALFAAWNAKGLNNLPFRLFFVFMTVIICASTVLIKQHSIIDVIFGTLLSVAVYPFVFKKQKRRQEL